LPAGKPAVSALPDLPRTSRHKCSQVWGHTGVNSRVDTYEKVLGSVESQFPLSVPFPSKIHKIVPCIVVHAVAMP